MSTNQSGREAQDALQAVAWLQRYPPLPKGATRPLEFEEGRYDSEAALLCPRCQEPLLHQGRVESALGRACESRLPGVEQRL